MAIRIDDGVAPKWWTPESEEGKDDAAEFLLRPLTGPEMLDVMSHFDAETSAVRGSGLVLACKNGLIDWKNITDGDDKPMKFRKSGLAKLSGELLAVMGGEVINFSTLDEDDAKN